MSTETRQFNWSLIVVVIIGFIAAGLFISTATAKVQSLALTDNEELIVVTGEGEVVSSPDTAVIYARIVTRLTEGATESQNKNNGIYGWLTGGLTANGVLEEDINTTDITLRKNETRSGGTYVFSNWEASRTVTVRVPIDQVESTLPHILVGDEVSITDVQLIANETDEEESEARALAIEDANKKAQELATESGLKLGDIHDISEGDIRVVGNESEYYHGTNAAQFGKNAGKYRVTADVTIAYKID